LEVEGNQSVDAYGKIDASTSYNSPWNGTFQRMPTLRELTEAIQRRPGVQTVVILGADGLVIETDHTGHDHAEGVAARVPAVMMAAQHLGAASQLGEPQFLLLELERGYGLIFQLSSNATLFVSTSTDVALGELLYDVRRHRAPMAALV
jgi:predicted regulator of Ras-like GTPase activity (Roadblock/LC7/MglB family)